MLNRLILIAALGVCTELLATPARTVADDYFLSAICLNSASGIEAAKSASTASAGQVYSTHVFPQNWAGELSREQLTTSDNRSLLWNASERLPAARQIKLANSHSPSGLGDFTWAALGEQHRQALNRDIDGHPDDLGAARLSRLRGEPCDDPNSCAALRTLPPLGDIIHSRPISVGQPKHRTSAMEEYDGPAGAYAAFKARARRSQVYVGANDGMLHAFDAETGEERWAFIPSSILARLPALTSPDYKAGQHRHFVDGRLVAEDVFYHGAWHTVLLGSLGAGGQAVFALDITDPDHISLLWEFSAEDDDDLGYLLGTPTIARLHSGQWAAVFGNGQESPSQRAALLLVEIETGALIKRLRVPAPASALAMPLVADTNGDGNADYAYAGDNLGNLWRFDLYDYRRGNLDKAAPETAATANHFRLSFSGKPLFSSPRSVPITSAPAIVSHPSETGYLLIVGTGQHHLPDSRDDQGPFTLYGIWDRQTRGQDAQAAGSVHVADLQQQRLQLSGFEAEHLSSLSRDSIAWKTSDTSANGKLGWYLDLRRVSADTGAERLLETPQKLGDLLFFTTRAPSLAPCKHPDALRLYAIDPMLGGRAALNVFDLNHDGVLNELDNHDGLAPSSISIHNDWPIVPMSTDGMPCLLGDTGCQALSLGPRANGRQSWRVVFDVSP